MVVFDLEWNRGYDKNPLNEVLQIGAVRVDRLGGPVVDVFDAYIKPVVHKRFDVGASALPELREYKVRGQSFAGAMEKFRAWCAGETEFASWGRGDLDILEENCAYWHVPPLKAEKVYDVQLAFCHLLGSDQSIALWRAADYCLVPDVFTFHNARNDALYTALVGRCLRPEDLAYKPEPKAKRVPLRFSSLPFARQPKRKVGPLNAAEQILDARESRRPPCPICGRTGVVTRWYFHRRKKDRSSPRQYFGVFSCSAHGRFICRVSVSETENKAWTGRRTVPQLTPELLREYAAAARGEVYICKGHNRKRQRRRGRNLKGCSPQAGS